MSEIWLPVSKRAARRMSRGKILKNYNPCPVCGSYMISFGLWDMDGRNYDRDTECAFGHFATGHSYGDRYIRINRRYFYFHPDMPEVVAKRHSRLSGALLDREATKYRQRRKRPYKRCWASLYIP